MTCPIPARSLRALALSFASALALSACATAPDLGATVPPGSKALAVPQPVSTQASAAPWPADAWWRDYGDPQLTALVEDAIAGAPDMAAAAARVRQADAQAREAGAQRLPQLSAQGQVAETRQSKNLGAPPALVPSGWLDGGQVSLNIGWDLDFWGRNKKALEAALSQAGAARADEAAARLLLAASVAQAYGDFAQLNADRDTAEAALTSRGATLELIGQRAQQGLESKAAVKRALANRAAAAADLALVDEQLALTRHRIAELIGQGPDRGLSLTRPATLALRPVGLPATLSVDFVGRRPDLAAARLRAQSAASRIGVARADFYPNVRLSALIGFQSLGLDLLTRSGSVFGSAGPAFSLPIFTGGRLEGAYRGARADYDLAVASYDQTLARALQEVADAASSQDALAPRLSHTREALAASQAAYDLALGRYRGGLAPYLDVLSAEDALIANRRAVADLEARAFLLDVALAKALGGGFRQPPQA
jgi:NodT family efflux transporter outer membrane factor (OMF) lipoprotein